MESINPTKCCNNPGKSGREWRVKGCWGPPILSITLNITLNLDLRTTYMTPARLLTRLQPKQTTKYSRYCSVFSFSFLKKYHLLIYFSWRIVTSKTFHLAVNLEYKSAYRIYYLLVPFLYSILSRNKNDSFRSLLVFHISSLQEENERQITYKYKYF